MQLHRFRTVLLAKRIHPVRSTRQSSTYQSPDPQAKSPGKASNAHRDFYRVFGRAWLKNFLVAVATYQALYWSWKKLESVEVKHDTEGEIRTLEGELRELTGQTVAKN